MSLFLGDSITTGGEIPGVHFPYPSQLDGINAGVPGHTVADTLVKLDPTFLAPNQCVHILFGANDVVEGVSADLFEVNLRALISRVQGDGRTIYLSHPYRMPAHPSLDDEINEYAVRITNIINEGAAQLGAAFVLNPPTLFDGVHPDQSGHDHMASLLSGNMGGCL